MTCGVRLARTRLSSAIVGCASATSVASPRSATVQQVLRVRLLGRAIPLFASRVASSAACAGACWVIRAITSSGYADPTAGGVN